MSKTKPIKWGAAIREGIQAAKANLLPGSILIICGVILVVSYYQVAPIRNLLEWVGNWQLRLGMFFAIPSTAFFGGVAPLIFRRIFLREGSTGKDYLFQVIFWGIMGLEVHLLYKMQALAFGNEVNLQTLLPKAFIDQFVYVPIIAIPSMLLGYLWKQCNYSLAETKAALRRQNYWERSIPLMISNWGVWVPAVFIIYSFPLPLQLPLQNLILTIWVMLVILLTRDKTAD
ncbi:hypothetical protein [Cerasicoccus maritimus]|uniref:hypothetical protein n=1 Tax=Cerasicoccus maritimus TaxID=490089 RepID=UPI00285291E1|nr:hypothetical protein [Cerasicoccus maritimus]